MLRIHFTAEDLTRVRLATGPEPMWEIVLSAHQLDRPAPGSSLASWRRQVLAALNPCARMVTRLAPGRGYSPHFLTPAICTEDVEVGLREVLHTSPERLRTEIGLLGRDRAAGWICRLAAGDPAVLEAVATGLRDYHARALAPFWPTIRTDIAADRALRADLVADTGIDGLLEGLHPGAHWRRPVLSIDSPVERDVELTGRGLLLIGSYFCRRSPVTLRDPRLPPVLVHPIAVTHDLVGCRGLVGARSLGSLLGRTRAAALQVLAAGTTTSGLAGRLGISVASASEHARVLRDAGLVSSLRVGNRVRHVATPLGRELINAGDGPAGGSH